MDHALPNCPKCSSEFAYQDRNQLVCPDCGNEWTPNTDVTPEPTSDALIVKDAHGNILKDGDSVTIVKDLKLRGSSQSLKVGTKVKSIRLVDGDHNIDCKIDGFGSMCLKSEFVKKS